MRSKQTQSSLTRRFLQTLPFYSLNFIALTAMSILFARWMGAKHYGAYVFAFHAIRIAVLIGDLGLSQAGMKYLPIYLQQKEMKLYRGYNLTGIFINLGLGLTLGYLAFVIMLPIIEGSHSHLTLQHAWWICPLLGINIFFSVVIRAGGHAIIATASQGFFRNFLALSLVYLLFFDSFVLDSETVLIVLAVTIMLCVLLQAIYQIFSVPKEIKQHRPSYNFKEWGFSSFQMFLGTFADNITTVGGIILLRLLSDEVSVAYYHAAWVLSAVLITPGKAVLAVASPIISHSYVNDRELHRKTIISSGRLLAYSTLPIVIALIVGGYYFLGWFGEEFKASYGLLLIIVCFRIFHTAVLFLGRVLSLSGSEKYVAKVSYLSGIASVALLIVLAYFLHAYGMAISLLAVGSFVAVLYFRKLKIISANYRSPEPAITA